MIRYTILQKQQMVQLRKEGLTLKEIAEKLGINNITTIANVCAEAGLPKKPYPIRGDYSTGQRFNGFVILGKALGKTSHTGRRYIRWECKCDCGEVFLITTKQIRRGQKSCGCLSIRGRFKLLNPRAVIGRKRFHHYKNGAKRRELDWNLSFEMFCDLLFGDCVYCKTPPFKILKAGIHQKPVNGVDRVDSNKGYCVDNCVSCCRRCNQAKGALSLDEFLDWIERLKKS